MRVLKRRSILAAAIERNPTFRTIVALARDSSVYLIGSVIVGIGSVLLLPLYTRSLTPEQFGVYALAEIAILVAVTISGLGFRTSYLKWFADTSEEEHSRLLGTVILTSLFSSMLGGLILVGMLSGRFGNDVLQSSGLDFIWILLPIVLLETVNNVYLTDLRARRMSLAFSITSIGRTLGLVVASFWLVAMQGQGLNGVFLGRLIGDFIGFLIGLAFTYRHISLVIRTKWIQPMLRYGAPIIWSALAVMLLDATGRYFLNYYGSLEDVGHYTAGLKISMIMRLLVTVPFGVAWGGLVFQVARRPSAARIYSRVFEYSSVFAMFLALCLLLLAPMLILVLTTPEYGKAVTVIPLLLLFQVCMIIEYPASAGILAARKTGLLVPVYAISIILNLVLNIILIPRLGMQGAAIALLASWMTIITLELWFGSKYYPLKINWRPFSIAVATYIFGALMVRHIGPGYSLLELLLILVYLATVVTAIAMWSLRTVREQLLVAIDVEVTETLDINLVEED